MAKRIRMQSIIPNFSMDSHLEFRIFSYLCGQEMLVYALVAKSWRYCYSNAICFCHSFKIHSKTWECSNDRVSYPYHQKCKCRSIPFEMLTQFPYLQCIQAYYNYDSNHLQKIYSKIQDLTIPRYLRPEYYLNKYPNLKTIRHMHMDQTDEGVLRFLEQVEHLYIQYLASDLTLNNAGITYLYCTVGHYHKISISLPNLKKLKLVSSFHGRITNVCTKLQKIKLHDLNLESINIDELITHNIHTWKFKLCNSTFIFLIMKKPTTLFLDAYSLSQCEFASEQLSLVSTFGIYISCISSHGHLCTNIGNWVDIHRVTCKMTNLQTLIIMGEKSGRVISAFCLTEFLYNIREIFLTCKYLVLSSKNLPRSIICDVASKISNMSPSPRMYFVD